jgi:serine/threonine-protein kinase RsbT
MTPTTVVARESFFPLRSTFDVVAARRGVRDWGKDLGLTVLDLTRVVTAASELARNAVVHGGGGVMCLQEIRQSNRRGLRAIFNDRGPGLPDLGAAMRDGYTTGKGMGLGLPGARRLVHDFSLSSTPSEGTCVTIVRWKA